MRSYEAQKVLCKLLGVLWVTPPAKVAVMDCTRKVYRLQKAASETATQLQIATQFTITATATAKATTQPQQYTHTQVRTDPASICSCHYSTTTRTELCIYELSSVGDSTHLPTCTMALSLEASQELTLSPNCIFCLASDLLHWLRVLLPNRYIRQS